MDALVMCGGEGRRLAATVDRGTPGGTIEKPLYEVGGTPMVDRVLAALADSGVETVRAAVSPNAPATREHLAGRVPLVETAGEGYVADLDAALAEVGAPALTVAADLPLLAPDAVDAVLDAAAALNAGGADALAVCVPAALKRRLGASVDSTFDPADLDGAAVVGAGLPEGDLAPTGLNVAGDRSDDATSDTMYVTYDARLAVNVNRARDARVAEDLL